MKNGYKNMIAFVRRPGIVLGIVAAAGLIIQVWLIGQQLLPGLVERQQVAQQLASVELLRQTTERIPLPQQVSSSDISLLLKQVPANSDTARFLLELKQLETKHSIDIVYLTFGGQSPVTREELRALIAGSNASAAPQPSIVREKVMVQMTGGYKELVDFVREVHQLDRLVSLDSWNLQPYDSTASELNLRLDATLSVYASSRFGEVFKDYYSPAPVARPELRNDPVMADESFFKLIESLMTNEVGEKKP